MTDIHNLRSLLRSLCQQAQGETVTIETLLKAVGMRAYGPVIALLGLVSISPLTLLPGANSLMAVIILIFSAQMAIGREAPWLPRKLLEYSFSRSLLEKMISTAEPYAGWLDKLIKPRLTVLTNPPFIQIAALMCMAAAVITIPLSFVPLGPVIPSLTVFLLGLAITARDGVALILGLICLLGAVGLAILLSGALFTS